MIDLREIRSLTDFQRNARDYISRMKETRHPLVLTVNGKAEVVVQDAEAYQEMLERLERAETIAAVRAAMDEFDRGEGRPAREALEELRKSMPFQVEVAPLALQDIEEAYLWLREQSPERAHAWYNGLLVAIYSLEEFPTRCVLARESEDLGFELRQLLYGKRGGVYRILFAVMDRERVRVFRVRHGARDRLPPEELDFGE